MLQAWMICPTLGGAEALDQLVCDGKTLRGSAIETEDGKHRFVAQVTTMHERSASLWRRRLTTLTNPAKRQPSRNY